MEDDKSMFACTESLRICLVTCGFSLIGWEMILRDGILFVFSNDIWFPESLKVIHVMHNICENYCTGKTRERLTSSTRYNVYTSTSHISWVITDSGPKIVLLLLVVVDKDD